MSGISKFKRAVKRTSAIILAALMTTACFDATVLSAGAASDTVLSNEARGIIYADTRSDFRDESIYFVMTTRFYNGDTSNDAWCWDGKQDLNDPEWRGDFKGLIEKLDYIKALGFTAIWITPVVENCSGFDYHGYHAINFSKVDPRYESDDCTYQDLIDAVHAKGMKIIQDVVYNHTGNFGESNLLPMFTKEGDLSSTDCLKQVPNSGLPSNYDSLIPDKQYGARIAMMKNTDGVNHDTQNIYHHYGNFDWDNYTCQIAQIAGDCVDLNTENPIVYNYLVNAYTKYINMGVDAFRVDTVRHISRLTLNKAFNQQLISAAKAAGNDDFFMFGEVCTRDNGNYWYRQNPGMSTPYYTWKESKDYAWSDDPAQWETNYNSAIQSTKDNADNISQQPTSTNAFLNGNDYHTPDYSKYSGLSVIDFPMHWSFKDAYGAFNVAKNGDQYYNDATWNVTYVDSHDYAPDGAPENQRFAGSQETWAENLDLIFTFRGIPCVYYGSETEFQKGCVIDDGPRLALKDSGRAYYGDNIEGSIITSDFTVFNASGQVAETLKYPLAQHIIRLNRIRQAVPALRKGQYSTEGVDGGLAFKRRYTDSNTDSFACVTISNTATFSGIPNGTYVDAVTGDTKTVTNGTLTASCSGQGNLRVYVLSTSKTPAPGRVVTNGTYLTDGGAAELIGNENINIVAPTSVSLSKTSVTVREAESESIKATVSPADATNKTVSWTSSNPSVATVSGGTITGVSKGTATITATTTNGKTATCKVTVTENTSIVKPTGISISSSSLELEAGQTGTLSATVSPSNATNKTVTWSSDDTSVATVSNGTVTAVAQGTATITAQTFNGYKATCTVTVTPKSIKTIDNGVYFEKPSDWGSNINIYLYDSSTNSTVGAGWPGTSMTSSGDGTYTYEYTTSNSNLMIVFNDGGAHQAPADKGFQYVNQGYYTSAGYQYKVEKPVEILPTSVSLSSDSPVTIDGTTGAKVTKGSTVKITATVAPSNATNKTLTWKSSDTSIATVSNGVVTGVSAGTATITATTSNGKTASIKVKVESGSVETVLTNTSTVSKTSVPKDTAVTVTGGASGGKGGYKYAFYYKKSTSAAWTSLGEIYGNTTTVNFVPAAIATYLVKVNVKDSAGTVVTKQFTVSSVKPTSTDLVNNSTLSATTVVRNNPIKITGAASGGSGSYKYAFYYKKTTSAAFTAIGTEYGTATTATFTPASTAEYNVRINVKDSQGTVVTKQYKITATSTGGTTALTNNSTVSATSVKAGDTVTLKGAASGGSGSYKYAFYYKKSTTASFTTIGTAYGTATTASFKPGMAATYNVKVDVKDSTGQVVSKTFTVTASPASSAALTNSSTISATSISKGNSVKITAKATGGTSPYYYAYYYKKSTSTSWTKVGTEYGTATTASVTPASTGTYNVMVKIMDNTGETVSKTFTVNVA